MLINASFQPVQKVDKSCCQDCQTYGSVNDKQCHVRMLVSVCSRMVRPFVKCGSQHTSALKTENN